MKVICSLYLIKEYILICVIKEKIISESFLAIVHKIWRIDFSGCGLCVFLTSFLQNYSFMWLMVPYFFYCGKRLWCTRSLLFVKRGVYFFPVDIFFFPHSLTPLGVQMYNFVSQFQIYFFSWILYHFSVSFKYLKTYKN